ncbi:MAG: TIGR02281 family clan AA aspartic protease [Sphingomonadaceae bacterium]
MRCLITLLTSSLMLSATTVCAANIRLVGLVRDTALLVVDDRAPQAYTVGTTIVPGYELLGVRSDAATIAEHGRPVSLPLGRYPAPHGAQLSLKLYADPVGQFFASGSINGLPARMLVDTGATVIALPAADATRFGIDYRKGRPAKSSTANGMADVFLVHVNRVRIGDVELEHFDAIVHESGLPVILLGNNFLDRFSLRREGREMLLTTR